MIVTQAYRIEHTGLVFRFGDRSAHGDVATQAVCGYESLGAALTDRDGTELTDIVHILFATAGTKMSRTNPFFVVADGIRQAVLVVNLEAIALGASFSAGVVLEITLDEVPSIFAQKADIFRLQLSDGPGLGYFCGTWHVVGLATKR